MLGFESDETTLGDEGYAITIVQNGAILHARTAAGLSRGVQTFRQLLPIEPERAVNPASASGQWQIPCVRIIEVPRYPHRGMLLDCGRHFMSKEFVKRYIDLLAYHKLNVLHWHLTEDQGWRIEISKYPKLTEIGAWRTITRDSERTESQDGRDGRTTQATEPQDGRDGRTTQATRTTPPTGRYGGFYTQDDVREIVAYAASRYIAVIPEIEMPGHSLAALASYPELSCTGGPFEVGTQWGIYDDVYCAGNERTFEFLEDVLSEVIELFPSRFIHIGGDECPKERWKKCAKCQARIKSEGLNDEHELQSYFIRRIEKFLNGKGRRLIGWDEILEGGLAPNATVQSWRGMDGAIAAATSGHDVISSPTSHCYLDYAQGRNPGEPTNMGFLPLSRVYEFEPTPPQLTEEQVRHVLGLEGNMWTEHAPPPLVDRQVFPRLCAIAEIGWSPKERRDWDDFQRRMKVHHKRLDALGVMYYVPPPQFSVEDPAFVEPFELALTPSFERGDVFYTLDGSEPTTASAKYAGPIRVADTRFVRARTILPNGNAGIIGEVRYRKLRPHEPVAATDTKPGLIWEYYEGRWSALPEFDKLKPAASGTTADRATAGGPAIDLSWRKRDVDFGLRFRGFLEVSADAAYAFFMNSDDGARLRIGDEIVIDNDGLHPPTERSGKVLLKRGRHPITIEYFQAGGALLLETSYEGPGVSRQPIQAVAVRH
jgi:hexosaminidase